jgi:hypothetical protein
MDGKERGGMSVHRFTVINGGNAPRTEDADDLSEAIWAALIEYADRVPVHGAIGILEIIKHEIIAGVAE